MPTVLLAAGVPGQPRFERALAGYNPAMEARESVAAEHDRIGRKAEDSDALDHAVRVGLLSYGLVHLLLAWLALQLAFGERSGRTSSSGALHQLAQTGLGRGALYVVAAGFAALVLWQGIEAVFGHREEEGRKRLGKRVVSAVKVGIYATIGYSALDIAAGSDTKAGGTDTWTSRLMALPLGVWLVGAVGLVVAGVGVNLVYRGWAEKFLDKLDLDGSTGRSGRAYALFGKAGYTAKGIALGIIGALFLSAAWTHDPQKSGGLDQALSQLLEQPFGAPMLVAVAAGIACYGLFCFAWARHLDR